MASCAARSGDFYACLRQYSHLCHSFPTSAALHRLRGNARVVIIYSVEYSLSEMCLGHVVGLAVLRLGIRTDLAARALESFLYFTSSTKNGILYRYAAPLASVSSVTDTEMVSNALKFEWEGYLELARNRLLQAAVAFEHVLTLDCTAPRLTDDSSECVSRTSRASSRALISLVETFLIGGKFQRAIDLLSSNWSLLESPDNRRAQVYHLRARAYAGTGNTNAALVDFSHSIATYTKTLHNYRGRTKGDSNKVEHQTDIQIRDAAQRKYCGDLVDCMPTVLEQERATVHYHRSLFRAAMALQLTELVEASTKLEDNEPRYLVKGSESPEVLCPARSTSFCSAITTEENQDCAIPILFNVPRRIAARRSKRAQKERMPLGALSMPMLKIGGMRYCNKKLNALGLEDLSEAISQNSALIHARLARAELQIAGGNHAFAFADFDAVLDIKPQCVEAHINRAVLFLNLQRNFVEARADLDRAISSLMTKHHSIELDHGDPTGTIMNGCLQSSIDPTRLCLALALY